ncbi:MAG: hypothetical protein EXR27_11245 [Betaproteobacteria bacterium]|nr:hypothetical protein [Betaproteobacteria bacterium]
MTTPPFALAAVIALWAWQSGQWLVAAGALALVEGTRLATRRFHFAEDDFNRVADFCTVIAAVAAVLLYVSYGNPRAITLWFQWLPLMLLPLVALQAWSDTREISLSVLFWSLRRNPTRRPRRVNLGYTWFAGWLLAASAANTHQTLFYFAAAAAAGALLWTLRPGTRRAAAWMAVMGLAIGTGYAAHVGLHRFQAIVENYVTEWLTAGGTRTDPYTSRTDIGHIGELKQSGRIQLRVAVALPEGESLLLHRASYSDYLGTTWIARGAPFQAVAGRPAAVAQSVSASPLERKDDWTLLAGVEPQASLAVHDFSQQGNPLLALPAGTVRVAELSATTMKRNGMGSVQIENLPGAFSYRAQYRDGATSDLPPREDDLVLPRAEQALLQQLAAELSLAGLAPAQSVARIRELFEQRFSYATWQPADRAPQDGTNALAPGSQSALAPVSRSALAPLSRSALARFLTETRAGHCEHFATATVLLLRAAGIPARYATGFSVREWSAMEGLYLVRQRHAHAWAEAWLEGTWQDIDTTPGSWFEAEQAGEPAWTRIADFWSFVSFATQQRYAALSRNEVIAGAVVLALLLSVWLAWRLFSGRETGMRTVAGGDSRVALAMPGADSAFFAVQQRLAARASPCLPSETLLEWLRRIAAQLPREVDRALLAHALELHYRYRFDPQGLAAPERELLARTSAALMAQLEQQPGGTDSPRA